MQEFGDDRGDRPEEGAGSPSEGQPAPELVACDFPVTLEESEATLRAFLEIPGAMRGVVEVLGDDLLHLRGNAAAAEFLGIPPEALCNQRATELGVPKKIVHAWMANCEESRRTNRPVTFGYERHTPRGDRWLSATVSALGLSLGDASWRARYCYEVRDLTEAQQAEEALMTERAARVAAEKRERRIVAQERARFAREMHDTLAQGVAGVVIQLEAAQDALPGEPETAGEHVERASQLARETLAGARRSVWALRPRVMEDSTLPSGLTRLVSQLAYGAPVQITFTSRGEQYGLARQTEDDLLRIGQEAITNALKHARASLIQVELTFGSSRVELSVQDDGEGFDPIAENQGDGLGLRGMRERAEHLGARLTVTSHSGEGTRVVVELPLPETEEGP